MWWCGTWTTDEWLRAAQISLQVLTGIAGLLVCLPLGWAYRDLGKCPLYASMDLVDAADPTYFHLKDTTTYGDEYTCSYVIFTAVIDVIYAVMWFWFYVVLSEWGINVENKSLEAPPDMVMAIPTMIFTTILFLCSLVVAGLAVDGYENWCHAIINNNNDWLNEDKTCQYTSTKDWDDVVDGNRTYGYLTATSWGGWLLVLAMGCQVVLAGVRFRLYFKNRSSEEDEDEDSDEEYTDDEELIMDDENEDGEDGYRWKDGIHNDALNVTDVTLDDVFPPAADTSTHDVTVDIHEPHR